MKNHTAAMRVMVTAWFSDQLLRLCGSRPFMCGDCIRHDSCGQPPDPECTFRLMQLEELSRK